MGHWPKGTEVKQGTWRDWYTGQPLENYKHPWSSQADERGKDGIHCLGLRTWWPDHDWNIQFNDSWWEGTCISSWRGCPCWNPNNIPMIKIRGLCPSSILRTKNPNIGLRFTPQQSPTTFRGTSFIGGMATDIFWGMSGWTIGNSVFNVTATSTASYNSYALGMNEWYVVGDDKNCYKGENYTIKLKLSGCQDGEFTCNDGQCISMEQRCDQLPDCEDESDERGCQLLKLKDGYNKMVPPIRMALDRTMIPVTVNVSIVLEKIVEIEEENHAVQFQFEIIMEWKDNRVSYENLKKDTSLNALPLVDIKRLWLPLVIYANTDQKVTTRLGMEWEWDTYITVTKQGNLTRSDLNSLHEIETFKGAENTLTMRQTYTYKFQCDFMLEKYPFDTQVKLIIAYLCVILSFRSAQFKWQWAHWTSKLYRYDTEF